LRRENVLLKEKMKLVQSFSSYQVQLCQAIKQEFSQHEWHGELSGESRSEPSTASRTGSVKEDEDEDEDEDEEAGQRQEPEKIQRCYLSLLQRLEGIMEEEEQRFVQLSNRVEVLVLQDSAKLSEAEIRMREVEHEKIAAISALTSARERFAERERELLGRIAMLEARLHSGRDVDGLVPTASSARGPFPSSLIVEQPSAEQTLLIRPLTLTSPATLDLASKFANQASEVLDNQSFLKFVNMLKVFKEGGLSQEQLLSKVTELFSGRQEMLQDFLRFLV